MQNWHSMEIRQRSGVHGKRRDLERSSTWILARRSEEHTSELQSPCNLVCRLLLEKKKISRHQLRRGILPIRNCSCSEFHLHAVHGTITRHAPTYRALHATAGSLPSTLTAPSALPP